METFFTIIWSHNIWSLWDSGSPGCVPASEHTLHPTRKHIPAPNALTRTVCRQVGNDHYECALLSAVASRCPDVTPLVIYHSKGVVSITFISSSFFSRYSCFSEETVALILICLFRVICVRACCDKRHETMREPVVRFYLFPTRLSSVFYAQNGNVVFIFPVVGVIETHYVSDFTLMSISETRWYPRDKIYMCFAIFSQEDQPSIIFKNIKRLAQSKKLYD